MIMLSGVLSGLQVLAVKFYLLLRIVENIMFSRDVIVKGDTAFWNRKNVTVFSDD